MKTFWSIIGVLVIATLAVWAVNGGGLRKPSGPAAAVPHAPTVTAAEAHAGRAEKTGEDPPANSSAPSSEADPKAAVAASAAADVPPVPPAAPPPGGPGGHNAYHGGSVTPTATSDSSGGPLAELSNLFKEASAPKQEPEIEAKAPAATPGDAGPAPASVESGSKYTLGPPTEVKAEEDGWTRLDGKYLVRGTGTAADPLIVPWELLVSASETYRPRTGIKEMPRRVADLKGKHVKVTGYALFPLMSLETTEVLLMRNQWDGCCIGVPPTPYDAVEVKLAKPADRRDSLLSFVTLEGVIDVDPYVNRDFLLGLYTMSGASLVQPAKGSEADKGL